MGCHMSKQQKRTPGLPSGLHVTHGKSRGDPQRQRASSYLRDLQSEARENGDSMEDMSSFLGRSDSESSLDSESGASSEDLLLSIQETTSNSQSSKTAGTCNAPILLDAERGDHKELTKDTNLSFESTIIKIDDSGSDDENTLKLNPLSDDQ